jgi:anti-anti-sigma factor
MATKKKQQVLRIQDEMTIYRSAELKKSMLDPLDRGSLEINLSGVTEIDTAGVQLLMLAKQTARQHGHELRLAGHSPAVLEVFELLNLGAWFGDPLVIHS